MSQKSIAQKLLLKSGNTFLLLNSPQDYLDQIGALPEDVNIITQAKSSVDVIQCFLTTKKGLEECMAELPDRLDSKGIFWISYPKGTSKMASEVNRDTINSYAMSVGWRGIAIFSVDETWSALRLRPM
jgi:hypothetical protein